MLLEASTGTLEGDVMKTKSKKFFRLVVIVVLIIAFAWIALPIQQVLHSVIPASKPQISWMYEMDKNMLISVADYLQKSGYHGIYIYDVDYEFNKKSGYMTTWNTIGEPSGSVPIEDPKVQRDINILFKLKGYSNIGKNENTIYFMISTAREHIRGIAYTIDGEPPVLDFVVDYELLSEEGHWYFYEENWTREYRLQVLNERFGE